MAGTNEWKRIPSFPNYSVSKDGKVRRIRPSGLKGIKSKLLKPFHSLKPFHYQNFTWYWLYRNGVRHKVAATKLVASAFIETYEDLRTLEVQMIDPAKGVYYTNLRWVPRRFNARRNEPTTLALRRYEHKKRYG